MRGPKQLPCWCTLRGQGLVPLRLLPHRLQHSPGSPFPSPATIQNCTLPCTRLHEPAGPQQTAASDTRPVHSCGIPQGASDPLTALLTPPLCCRIASG